MPRQLKNAFKVTVASGMRKRNHHRQRCSRTERRDLTVMSVFPFHGATLYNLKAPSVRHGDIASVLPHNPPPTPTPSPYFPINSILIAFVRKVSKSMVQGPFFWGGGANYRPAGEEIHHRFWNQKVHYFVHRTLACATWIQLTTLHPTPLISTLTYLPIRA